MGVRTCRGKKALQKCVHDFAVEDEGFAGFLVVRGGEEREVVDAVIEEESGGFEGGAGGGEVEVGG